MGGLSSPVCFRRRLHCVLLLLCVAIATSIVRRPHLTRAQSRGLAAYNWDYEEDAEEQEQQSRWQAFWDFVTRKQRLEEPHPMRMERWAIIMHQLPFRKVERCMDFHRDGTCEVVAPESPEGVRQGSSITGKWRYDKYGLNWELEERGVKHFYHAELIWHSFGERPKMHCGVCVRDRGPRSLLPKWLLRPVVATFHGYGNGTDTYFAEGFADRRFETY